MSQVICPKVKKECAGCSHYAPHDLKKECGDNEATGCPNCVPMIADAEKCAICCENVTEPTKDTWCFLIRKEGNCRRGLDKDGKKVSK